ncbi:MAG: hypothetical protein ACI8UD_001141 [Planctomycetota bacterium]
MLCCEADVRDMMVGNPFKTLVKTLQKQAEVRKKKS